MDSTLDDLMADGEVATTHRGTPPGRPWLPLLLVAGLALVMATGGWFATRPGGGALVAPLASAEAQGDRAAVAAASLSRAEPATVWVPGGLVGRPRHRVVSWLEARDLVALTVPVTNPGDRRPGTVTAVAPTGTVEVGSTVRVEYVAPVARPAAPRPEPSAAVPDEAETGEAGGTGGTGEATTRPREDRTTTRDADRDRTDDRPDEPQDDPTTEPEPEPAQEPKPCKDKGNGGGKGDGNGNGNGNGNGRGSC